jgi:hypothetical protein
MVDDVLRMSGFRRDGRIDYRGVRGRHTPLLVPFLLSRPRRIAVEDEDEDEDDNEYDKAPDDCPGGSRLA